MTAHSREDLDRALRRIRSILARAQHPNTPEAEKDTALKLAAKLQRDYGVDEQMLNASLPPEQRTEPVVEDMQYSDPYSEWRYYCGQILDAIAEFGGCKVENNYDGTAKIVGFPADVRFVELVMNGAMLELLSRMDPKWDPERTEDENVAFLYEAGIKWRDIADMGGFDWPDGGKLIRAYKRQCKREGREPLTVQRKEAYRNSFASGFAGQMRERVDALLLQRKADDVERDANSSVSTELVLADRSALVNQKFWEIAPHMKPLTQEEREDIQRRWRERAEAERAAQIKAMEERQQMLDAMSPRDRERFLAKEEQDRIKAERKEARERAARERRWAKEDAAEYDYSGQQAGRRAANSVDLSGGRGSVGGSGTQALN